MSVHKRKRELLRTAKAISPEATIVQTPGSHFQVTVHGPAGSHKVFCPLTPSDSREQKNYRRDLMRAARLVGIIAPSSSARVPNDADLS